ncbi:MAG: aminotransferase class III-fold pyridoxal phosphate-dependent enzyme [candidate division WOR-3 bacterium]|nr:MAG: aminotransferase class III-fold pyridoxal phosphate-dependent enzyme [candidate division WOR-3 bacterium]
MTERADAIWSPQSLNAWLRRHGPLGPEQVQPPIIRSAQGIRLQTIDGRGLLDFSCGGVLPIGHNPPLLMRSSGQKSLCGLGLGQEHADRIALMHELAELVPGGMNRRAMLCDSGREAMAQAVSLAFSHTGRCRVVYLSECDGERPQFESDVAAVVVHPFDSRLAYVAESCSHGGALLVDDETMLAPGTTGRTFAIEWSGLKPDLYVFGRGMAAGLPFGACVTGSSKMRWQHGTIGASIFACSVAMGYFSMLKHGMLESGTVLGALLRDRLDEFADRMGGAEVQGAGLSQTLVLKEGRKADAFVAVCQEQGLLMTRVSASAVQVYPSLIVSKDDISDGLEMMARAAAELGWA